MAQPRLRSPAGTRRRVRAVGPCSGAALALFATASAWGCGGDGGSPLGAVGPGRTFAVEANGPAVLVGAAGGLTPDRLGVRVRGLAGPEVATRGLEVRFEIERGGGRVLAASAFTDADGIASVPYATSAASDSTLVRAFVAEDPGAALRLRVLSRPALSLDATPGSVVAVPDAAEGVLLAIPAGATVDLVPYRASAEAGRSEYVFRAGSGVFLDQDAAPPAALALAPAAPRAEPPRLPLLPAPVDTTLTRNGRLPEDYDVANCALGVHRFAPLVRAGRSLALYVDGDGAPDPARVAEIVDTFDDRVAPLLQELFGPPVDLDANDRVLAVMSRAMRPDAGVYCGSVQRRGREVIYTAWDPAGPLRRQLQILTHEYQHVLNASQHFRWDRTGRTSDAPWLDEGLSHVAEWKAGFGDDDLARTFSFLVRVNAGLALLAERADADLGVEERFAAGRFLFALYLGDRFGREIYRALGMSGLAGRDNVELVTGVPFRDLVRDWFVTLALSSSPPGGSGPPDDTSGDGELVSGAVPAAGGTAALAWRYGSIDLRGEEARAQTCGCLPAPRLPGVAFETVSLASDVAIVRTLDVLDADFIRFTAGERPAVLYFAGGTPDVELFAIRSR